MAETRKIAAILVADVVGYSRLAGADEERTLSRLRALRSDLIDPAIAAHHGRVVKRTGDGALVEFRSVVDALRCAMAVQGAMSEREADAREDERIAFRMGIHLGDVVEEADGDLMGDGVNIAARLEGVAEPGGICLSEDAWRHVKGKHGVEARDLGLKRLKNIAEPVRVYALDLGGRPGRGPVRSTEKSAPPRLSIVVLPFGNIGGDPDQEHFVDGITESLTTDLSRIRGALIIARNTAFTYKGKPVDVKAIGRELNVRYALEGSVQRAGNRMRINVQLIDAETGSHLWAERFDKPLADLFDMQDEIVARLAGALNTQLVAVEARRAERAATPDSMDLYFQGTAWFSKGLIPHNMLQARGFYVRALDADPGNVDALIGLASVEAVQGVNSFVPEPAASFAAAEARLTEALSSAPDHAVGHMWLGLVHIFTKRAAEGIAECEHALALDRNLAVAAASIGFGKILTGRAEETEAQISEALRLSPRDSVAFVWFAHAGLANNHLGKWEQSAAWCRRAIEANRNYARAHFQLALALAQLGQLEEAHASAAAGATINPSFTVSRARADWSALSDDRTYLAQLEPVLEGLRKAGVPER